MIKFEFKEIKIKDKRSVWGAGLTDNGLRGLYYGLLVFAKCDVNPDTQNELAHLLGLSFPTFSKYRDLLQEYNYINRRVEEGDIIYELYIPKYNHAKRS